MEQTLSSEEKTILKLRTLYRKYGYQPYKMNRFEEYDLYVRNKDFLVSDNIITFTDTDGRLMALKPDVTLSIVKNSKDVKGTVQKLCYNENVCRTSSPGKPFREIMQAGLECIGDIDDYCRYEVLLLASESLKQIADTAVLAVSHLGIVADVLDSLHVSSAAYGRLIRCIRGKNLHEAEEICKEEGVSGEKFSLLSALMSASGTPAEVFPALKALLPEKQEIETLETLERIISLLPEGAVKIDFSLLNDMHYYNGIVFQGFVSGVPDAVLSGGEYDLLMQKMGKKSKALGFAVYLDKLEFLLRERCDYDVDVLLLYGDAASPADVAEKIRELTAAGTSVSAQKSVPEDLRFRDTVTLGGYNA